MTTPPDVDPPTERIPRVPAPRRRPTGGWWALGVFVAIFVAGVVIAVTGFDPTTSAPTQPGYTQLPESARSPLSAPTAVGSAPAAAPSATVPAAAAPDCVEAQPAVKGQIEAALTDPSMYLDTVYVVRERGLTYYGASIFRSSDGERVSSADVWVTDGTRLAALSGSAVRYSTLPDGRRLFGVSAGDEPGQAVEACSTALILRH